MLTFLTPMFSSFYHLPSQKTTYTWRNSGIRNHHPSRVHNLCHPHNPNGFRKYCVHTTKNNYLPRMLLLSTQSLPLDFFDIPYLIIDHWLLHWSTVISHHVGDSLIHRFPPIFIIYLFKALIALPQTNHPDLQSHRSALATTTCRRHFRIMGLFLDTSLATSAC